MKNIISCSRRTDVPRFYYKWLQYVLSKEKVELSNPYNEKSYTVDLKPEDVGAIVLWSKDFSNVAKEPGLLDNYNLYFQYTITNYGRDLESNVVEYEKTFEVLETLRTRYKSEQFNFRYDPIIITDKYTVDERLRSFEKLCLDLKSVGMDNSRITTSFLDVYKKVQSNLNKYGVKVKALSENEQLDMINEMGKIALDNGFQLFSCSSILLEKSEYIKKGHCIDGELLSELFNNKLSKAKDQGQRKACGCSKSKDIGKYSMKCFHRCIYCYANSDI